MPRTVDPVVPDGRMGAAEQPSIVIDDELILRPLGHEDVDAVLAAFRSPDIQFWHGFRADTDAEAIAWIDRTHTLWRESKSVVWAIADRAGRMHGRCALYVDTLRGTAEIAYWVLPDCRSRGVAVRAAVAATAWAHDHLGVHRVLLQHSTRNTASCVVAQRAGYRAEGTAREQDLHTDGWHDMHQHAHVVGD